MTLLSKPFVLSIRYSFSFTVHICITISRLQCRPINLIKNALYLALHRIYPSRIQLATALITRLRNGIFLVICGVGHVLCEFFILSFVSANGLNFFILNLNLNVYPRAPVDVLKSSIFRQLSLPSGLTGE